MEDQLHGGSFHSSIAMLNYQRVFHMVTRSGDFSGTRGNHSYFTSKKMVDLSIVMSTFILEGNHYQYIYISFQETMKIGGTDHI